jgi:glycine cleavage system H protein
MSELPEQLRYAKTHEWVKQEDDNVLRVGITDFAQQELGDLVYVELPEVGRKIQAEEQCAVVESVKTASDLYSPVAGEIIEINEVLADEPERVNDDPYSTWLFCIRANDVNDLAGLMDAAAYAEMIAE